MARVGILNFGYIMRSGIENFADNVLRQIDKLDDRNSYMIFVNKYAESYYISSGRISKVVVGRMAQNQILKTIENGLFSFIPLFRFSSILT